MDFFYVAIYKLKLNINKRRGMIGDGKIIFRRVSVKAFNRAARLTDYKNVIDCVFEGLIVILGRISPRKTIVISNAFFGILNSDIVRVAITVFQQILYGFGSVICVQVTDENGRAVIFFAVFFDFVYEQMNLVFSCFVGAELILRITEGLAFLRR